MGEIPAMKNPFDHIRWPLEADALGRLSAGAGLHLIETFVVPSTDLLREAIGIAHRVAAGEPLAELRAERLGICWESARRARYGMSDRTDLEIRLAIGLLGPPAVSMDELSERLEWTIEFIERINGDGKAALEASVGYFVAATGSDTAA
ncbi:hypothetical protein ACFJIW_05800 [Tahibacter sp. UC22_41]|uniref:hypothetical protein n=1 Tax=Tahibacter sp. UC22_41 TaxID=3350178 RepID=UPI0036DDE5E0